MSSTTIRLVTRSGPIRFDMVDVNTSTTTIASFKQMIASTVNIPVENQCILTRYPSGIQGIDFKEMRGEQTMCECCITHDVHLFVWPSTDPVVTKIRAHERRQDRYSMDAAKVWEEENAFRVKEREDREDIIIRTREEDRLTQLWLQEYEKEVIKAREADVYWAEWRKKHNLFGPASKK